MCHRRKLSQSGITLPEVLIAAALLVTFLIGVGSLTFMGLAGAKKGMLRIQASALAQEAVEAVFAIRDAGGINFAPSPESDSFLTAENEYYLPTIVNQQWQLGDRQSIQPPPPLPEPNSTFSRIVRIEKVRREPLGIACLGDITTDPDDDCEDKNTRKIIVTVSWQEFGGQQSVRLVTYLTNI